jgi:hypothetical protein
MYCPSDVNTGIVELVGPLLPQYLNSITINSFPLSISFSPRTTPVSIIGNRIDESTDNVCTYRGSKYSLNGGGQICNTLHSGYILPGQTTTPVAELVFSFVGNNNQISGILLCFPIYEDSAPNHDAYLQQIINNENPAASIQTILYDSENDNTQVSFAYKTCFETIDSNNEPSSHTLYIVVFPRGIRVTQTDYQKLLQQIGTTSLPDFQIPPAFRNGEKTIKSYKFNDSGVKVPTTISEEGYLYKTSISSCSEDFQNRFEYFTQPPRLPSTKFSKDVCPYYKTTQYKCVPFNQMTDLSGLYVVPGGKTLDTILQEKNILLQQQINQNTNVNLNASAKGTISGGDVETIIASVIGGLVALSVILKAGSWLSKNA